MKDFPHLVRRTWQSYTARPLSEYERDEVRAVLNEDEFALWQLFGVQDQRHSLLVFRRFVQRVPTASPDALRAALLHDIGKTAVQLSTTLRVIATFVGPRTHKFRIYHAHEAIGLELLKARSTADTLWYLEQMFTVGGTSPDAIVRALCLADHV
jgi:hypothetical protein